MNRSEPTDALPPVLIALMKGVTYREDDPALWEQLLRLQSRVREHVGLLGLQLLLDEAEGHAFLRQRPPVEGEAELPRLIPRRPLSYPVSLLLVLLRKRLAEFEGSSGEPRLILRREDIADLMRLFWPERTNEAKLMDRLDTHLTKVVEMGFLRRLRGSEDEFEVRRILKSFVDAQWLEGLERGLASYREHLLNSAPGDKEGLA